MLECSRQEGVNFLKGGNAIRLELKVERSKFTLIGMLVIVIVRKYSLGVLLKEL